MSTRGEKERAKVQQEKFQAALSALLKDDDNKYCVDCDAKGPRWASWNLGIFLCIRCAGIHRNMGVHISRVKSVNLDSWTPEQVAMMQEMGNSRARAVYEANVPDSFRRPQTDSALEAFIRAKYENKKYIAREWIPPKPVVPKELLEDDKVDKKRSKLKPATTLQLNSVPKAKPSPTNSSSAPKKLPENTQTKPSLPQTSLPPQQSSNAADLIGLDATSPTGQPNGGGDLLADIFGTNEPSQSALPAGQAGIPQQNGGFADGNLFDEGSADGKGPKSSTKESILALYGGGQQTQQQMFGVPGGMYMPQQNMGMYGGGMVGQQMPGQQMAGQQSMQGMAAMPQQYQHGMMPGVQLPGNMYGMGQMGGMPGGMMGTQGNMMMQQPVQGNIYAQQQQMQQMQLQQMQQQMAAMKVGTGQMGGMPQTAAAPGGGGWGGSSSGQTLSTNLWQ